MKVSFNEIAAWSKGRQVQNTGWAGGTGIDFCRDPVAFVQMVKIDEKTVSLKGSLTARIHSSCSRCGNGLERELDSEFDYVFRLGQDSALLMPEKECSDEDCETVYITEPVIDISEVLTEQLILAMPGKLLCKENCQGICQYCGQLLDSRRCDCRNEMKDSPFAILEKLKNQQK